MPSLVRVLLWTVAGAVFGLCVIPCLDFLEAYPLINMVLSLLCLPASLLCQAIRALGLAPHGDAGFVLIPISMVLQWTILGFLYGLYRRWQVARKRTALSRQRETGPGPDETADSPQRVLHFARSHKQLLVAFFVLVLAIGYCLWEEMLLSKDRDFFLHHVDHKGVAEACLDILSKAEADRWTQVGLYLGPDPRLPEAIRRLDPEAVSIHVDDIAITKTPRHFYNCLEFARNRTNPTRYDLFYVEGPRGVRTTCVYSIYRK